jgi:hypothetical protein
MLLNDLNWFVKLVMPYTPLAMVAFVFAECWRKRRVRRHCHQPRHLCKEASWTS